MSHKNEIIGLLRVSVELIRDGDMERAAWRVADAAGLLRLVLESDKASIHLCGLAPTGRGFQLPRMQQAKKSRS